MSMICTPPFSRCWDLTINSSTYRYNGRDFRSTEAFGEVMKAVMA